LPSLSIISPASLYFVSPEALHENSGIRKMQTLTGDSYGAQANPAYGMTFRSQQNYTDIAVYHGQAHVA
jgi:hypothetical protein